MRIGTGPAFRERTYRVPDPRAGRLAALAAVAVLAAGCSSASAAPYSYLSPGSRSAAPLIHATLLSGGSVTLPGYGAGHVTVINVWGSWCAPCRAETAALSEAYRVTAPAGVRFLGDNVRDDADQARAFLAGHAVAYPSLFDPAGTVVAQLRIPSSIPATAVLDTRGRVAAFFTRPVTAAELATAVARVVAEGTPAGAPS